jgi:hypothetical protein
MFAAAAGHFRRPSRTEPWFPFGGEMFRLLVFCALLAGVANPTARAWLRPHLDPILDPISEWSVRSRVSEIARKIGAEQAAGRIVPTVGIIDEFVSRHYHQKDSHLDPWGTPFHVVRTAEGLRVASAGRDEQIHTPDDVLSPPLPSPTR